MNLNRKLTKNWKKALIGISAAAMLTAGIGGTASYAASDDTAQASETSTLSDTALAKGQQGGFTFGNGGRNGNGQGGFGGGQMPGNGQMPEGMMPPDMSGMPQFEKGEMPEFGQGEMPQGGQMTGPGAQMGGMAGGQMMDQNVTYQEEPSEIVTSDAENTAITLTADEANAETIVMTDENSEVKIESAGTYIITGSCEDGNITVKKGTTGVVLILKDLDLSSSSGAAVSCNKGSEVKIIVEGNVTLTDAEDPADETSTDTEIADAFDGAALKIKDGANVALTGTGTLTIDASACKNGIKVGDADTPSFVIDGDLTLNITAANDAINSGYDLTILSGTLNITAGDDAIHADRILTIGSEDGSGPAINILSSNEGLEGTVVNLFGGTGSIQASDDGINAANSDNTYADSLTFSINITGGTWTVNSGVDGLDSNGNVNAVGGSTTIHSAATAVDCGIDYDGLLYIADGTVDNSCGVSGPDGMMDGMGQRGGMGQSGDMGERSGMGPMRGSENAENSTGGATAPTADAGDLDSSESVQPDADAGSETSEPGFFSRIGSSISGFFGRIFGGR